LQSGFGRRKGKFNKNQRIRKFCKTTLFNRYLPEEQKIYIEKEKFIARFRQTFSLTLKPASQGN